MSNPSITLILKGDATGLARALQQASGDTVKELGKAENAAARWKKQMADVSKVAKAGLLAVAAGATAAAAGIVAGVRQSINAMDEVGKASRRIGVTTEALGELRYAAELSGVANTTLEKGLVQLINRQAEAQRGNKQYAQSFEQLGIQIANSDGSLRGTTDLIGEIAEQFKRLPEGPERAKLAIDLFGKSGTQLIPMLLAGKEGLAEMASEANQLGLVFDKTSTDSAEAFNDNLTRLQKTFQGVFNILAAQVLPTLESLSTQFVANVKDAGAVQSAAASIRTGFQLLVAAGSTVVNTFQIIGKSVGFALFTVDTVVTGIRNALGRSIDAIQRFQTALRNLDFSGAREALKQGFAGVTEEVSSTIGTLSQQQREAFDDIKGDVVDLASAWKGVGEPVKQVAAETKKAGEQAAVAAPKMRNLAEETRRKAEADKLAAQTSRQVETAIGGINRLLDQQAAQLGGPVLRAAQAYRDQMVQILLAEEQLRAAGALDAENIAKIVILRANAFALYQNAQRDLAATAKETSQTVQREFTDTERVGLGFFDSLLQAGADFASRQIKSFRDLFDAFKSIAQRALSDIIYLFLRSKIMVPLEMAVMGGQGLGGGLASIFGGGGAGGGIFSQLSNLAGGGIGNLLTSLGGFIGGGSPVGFGAGLTSAGLNFASNGFFGGIGSNLAGGFGNLFGGSFMTGLGQLAGVLGPLVGIAGLVDSISGGRLFGTSYKPESAARQLSIGADGASGFESITESRRRSLFRGTRRRTTTSDLDAEAQDGIENLFAQVQGAIESAARALGTETATLVGGTFRQEFDAKGNLKREWIEIAGRIYEEGQEAFAQRLLGENIIASVAQAFADAGSIAERWRGSAQDLLDGSQFLLAVSTQMRQGFDLLGTGTLAPIVDLVEELQESGESLVQTYARLAASTTLMEQAFNLSGATIDRAREQFVRFSADVAAAAGGVDQLTALLQGYEQAYFSAEERARRQLDAVRGSARSEFGDIGLRFEDFEGEGGMAQLRQMFEQRLPTLGADAVVEWLQALNVLAAANAAQQAYNETINATAIELVELNEQALASYGELAQGLRDQLADLSGTAFQRQLREIARQYNANVTALNRAAREAGLAAAATEDLATAFTLASTQAAQALAQLMQAGRQQAAELYGSRLTELDALIAAETARANQPLQNFAGAVGEVARAASDATRLLLGDLSPLKDRQKLDIALEALRRGEIGGDEVLRIADRLFASGSDFNRVFAQVQQILASRPVTSAGQPEPIPTTSNGLLAQLQAERERLLAEENQLQRFGRAQDLARTVADIAGATGESFEDVFRQLVGDRATFSDFATDLRLDSASALDAYLRTLQAQSYDVADLAGQMREVFEDHLAGLREIFGQGALRIVDTPEQPLKPSPGVEFGLEPLPIVGGKLAVEDPGMAEQTAVLRDVREFLAALVERLPAAAEDTADATAGLRAAVDALATTLTRTTSSTFDSNEPRSARAKPLEVFR